jgi:uncharacterized membrane protein (Fun14 family)
LSTDLLTPISATIGGGFFGVLLGYALKKVVKLLAVIVGLFIGGLAYLQYQQVASIDWLLLSYCWPRKCNIPDVYESGHWSNISNVKLWYSINK